MLYKGSKCYIKSCLRYKLTVNYLVVFVSVVSPLVSVVGLIALVLSGLAVGLPFTIVTFFAGVRFARVCLKLLNTSFIKVGKSSVVSGRAAVFRRFAPAELVDSTVDWVAERFRPGVDWCGGFLAVLVDCPGDLAVFLGIGAPLWGK